MAKSAWALRIVQSALQPNAFLIKKSLFPVPAGAMLHTVGGVRASGMEPAAHKPSHELRAGIADLMRLYSKERLPEALGCPAPEERSVAPFAKAAGSTVSAGCTCSTRFPSPSPCIS